MIRRRPARRSWITPSAASRRRCRVSGVIQTQQSLLTDDDLRRELAASRSTVSLLIDEIREFSTIAHETPWRHLDDVLSELRAAVTTVAALEGLQVKLVE